MHKYLLITPIKNEEKYLPKLFDTVINQTIKPLLWIIVNDRSTDNSRQIIDKFESKYDWIRQLMHDEIKDRDVYNRNPYPYVCQKGFDYAIELCSKKYNEYDCIAALDADMLLDPNYFEILLEEFKKNNRLGIACGQRWDVFEGVTVKARYQRETPYGAASVFRRKCFEQIGGYFMGEGVDAVANAKAKMKGWQLRIFEDTKSVHLRPIKHHYRNASGTWAKYKFDGHKDYYLNHSFILVLIKALSIPLVYVPRAPIYAGLAYLMGFLLDMIKRVEKVDDEEARRYYKSFHLSTVIREYVNKTCNYIKKR